MKPSSRRRVAGVAVLAIILVMGAEIGGWGYYRSASRRADARLRRAERDLESRPAPTEASARALAIDLEAVQRTLAALERGFAAANATTERNPADRPADLFFAAGEMVQAVTADARALNIRLSREAAGLGFSAYGQVGPESSRAAAVRRQLEIGRDLLAALVAARPRAILAVQREVPLTEAERQARHAPPKRSDRASPPARISSREGADYFAIDPQWSVFAAGVVDTVAFRLVFVGDTGVLRAFMSAASAGKGALVVRSVEVDPEPASPTESVKAKGGAVTSVVLEENSAPRPTEPLVSHASKFTVVVEHIDIIPAARDDAAKSGT